MTKYSKKIQIHKALWIIKCDACDNILASADSREYLPEFSTCNCDNNKHLKKQDMKRIITIFILMIALGSYGQEVIFKKDYYGNTVATDKYGRTISTKSTDYYGRDVWKDNRGNTIQTGSTDYYGNYNTYDNRGNIKSTYSNDHYGNTMKKDNRGNTERVYKQNRYGGTDVYDNRGNRLGAYEKDYYGNTIYKKSIW